MPEPLWQPPEVEVIKATRVPFGTDENGEPIREMDGSATVGCLEAVREVVMRRVRLEHPEASDAEVVAAGEAAVDEVIRLLNESIAPFGLRVDRELLFDPNTHYSYEFHHLVDHYARRVAESDEVIVIRAVKSVPPALVKMGKALGLRRIYSLVPRGSALVSGVDVRAVHLTDSSAIVQWFPDREIAGLPEELREEYLEIGGMVWKALLESLPESIHGLPKATAIEQLSPLKGDAYFQWEIFWENPPKKELYWLLVGGILSGILLALAASGGELALLAVGLAPLPLVAGFLIRAWRLSRAALSRAMRQAALQQEDHIARYEDLRRTADELLVTTQELRRRLDELEGLHEISLSLSSTLDEDAILDMLIESVTGRLGYERAFLFLRDEERDVLVFRKVSHPPESPELRVALETSLIPLIPGESWMTDAWLDGQAVVWKGDVGRLGAGVKWLVDALGIDSFVAAPMRAGESLLGVLLVDSRGSRREFDDADRRVLSTLCATVAVALENARLYRRTDEALAMQLDELAILHQIDLELNASLDFNRVMSLTLDWAMRRTGATVGMLGQVDDASNAVRWLQVYGLEFPQEELGRWRLLTSGIVARVVHTDTPALVDDVSLDPDYIELSPDTKSQLAVPIRLEGSIVGVLSLESDRLGGFDENDLGFVMRLADRAAVAIENARLFEEVQRQREQLEAILSGTADAVIVVDNDGRIVLMNDAACDAFQLNDEADWLMRPLDEVLSDSPLVTIVREVFTHGDVVVEEVGVGDRVLYASLTPVPGVGIVIVMQDITHLKEMDRLKTELIATVSHDLKSPLNVIRGYATLLDMRDLVKGDGRRYVEMISRAVVNMQQLIDDLLDLARIESGIGLNLQPCEADEIIKGVVEQMSGQADAKRIDMRLELSSALPRVVADPDRLHQVVANLVSNAIKYTPEGGQVTVRAAPRDGSLLIEVEDTGIGIPPDAQPRVFEKFFRVRTPETEHIEGTGLGLAIVKSLVEAHGGQVWLRSAPGQGSTFSFTMPVARD